MTMKLLLAILLLFSYASCTSQSNGTYCADVDYYNSKTGTQSQYTLTAEVSNGKLVQLNFPSGGHIDEGEYGYAAFDSDGVAYAKLKGKTYKVKLLNKGSDCFDNVPLAKRCRGTTKAGSRCKNETDNSSGYCWRHK